MGDFIVEPKLIGTIGFWKIKMEHFRAEIGYSLYPQHQGKGFMNEAMKAVLNMVSSKCIYIRWKPM